MTTRQASREGLRSRYDGQRMSEEEYLALPEENPSCEWVEGVVVQKAVPNADHGSLIFCLAMKMGPFITSAGGRGRVEARTLLSQSDRAYRLPALSYWAPGRPDGDDTVPTLAVEVRSPGETMRAQREKCRRYRENGVDVCWLIDPQSRTVEVFEGELDGKVLAAGDVLATPHMPAS